MSFSGVVRVKARFQAATPRGKQRVGVLGSLPGHPGVGTRAGTDDKGDVIGSQCKGLSGGTSWLF